MKTKRISPAFIACLIACFLLVGGVMTAQAVEHSQQHAEHHHGTHSTLLCSWFCAAGQTLETDRVLINGPGESLLAIESWCPAGPQEILVIFPVSRAPPSFI